jgi:hypothetical protein
MQPHVPDPLVPVSIVSDLRRTISVQPSREPSRALWPPHLPLASKHLVRNRPKIFWIADVSVRVSVEPSLQTLRVSVLCDSQDDVQPISDCADHLPTDRKDRLVDAILNVGSFDPPV